MNINDYKRLNVNEGPVIVDANGIDMTIGTQQTSAFIYWLAVLDQADGVNSGKIANQINLMQAKNNEQRKVAGLLAGLQSVSVLSGEVSVDEIYTKLQSKLQPFRMSDTEIAEFFRTATGESLGGNNLALVMTETRLASAITNAKTYSQNLLGDSSVLQNQLENMTNIRTSFYEGMSSIIKNYLDLMNQLARAL